ncbi:amino acid transporter [Novosphingobium capsulatum]|uniref:Amino acid transporter n=2 Tax=Novosphingobium TaxID=165696 RepID=A0ABU1MQZ7_9SPHN|nr:APC family permease [Novosphingobium capsulatum]MDR6512644.1 amino acid transporter [Novosphingobium capsulatum]
MTDLPPSSPASSGHRSSGPRAHLHVGHAMLVALGMVMSTDSLKTAPTVAANAPGGHVLLLWVAGALVTMVGALCYVEMAAAFPDSGGEYSFLRRAWGGRVAALYAWSRFAIMHTGWIALMAHLLADYASALWPLGHAGRTVLALAIVAALTALNLVHVRLGFLTQALLVALVAAGFACVTAAGLLVPAPAAGAPLASGGSVGVALIYVFLAYGGWSDMATLSGEVRGGRRAMLVVVIGALALLMLIYCAMNWALLRGLGPAGLAASTAPGADLARTAFGPAGAWLTVGIVAISAISSINSTLIVCSRVTASAAADLPALAALGNWHDARGTPARATLAVGGFSLLLTAVSGLSQSGFGAMVDYMTPVYWLFVILGMAALIRLRRTMKAHDWPVRTPLFPLFPLAFMALSAAMLWSSLTQLGPGALAGAAVLLLGLVLGQLVQRRGKTVQAVQQS